MLKHLVEQLTVAPMLGIDLGSAVLKAVEVDAAEGRVVLRCCAVVPVEGDAASAGHRLIEAVGPSRAEIAIGVASPELVVRPVTFPRMPRKELASAIRLEAEQTILNGHTLAEMVVDWHPLSPAADGALRGVLAVVPKTMIADRLAQAKAAGLRPTLVDAENLALWNAYWALVARRDSSPQTVVLMNIGARTTNLVIGRDRDELILARDLQGGAGQLGTSGASEWIADVRDSLTYARAKAGLRTLDRMVITGGGSSPDLASTLQAALPAPLTFWNPLDDLVRDADSPPVNAAVGPLLAIAIGLSLRKPT